MKRALLMLVAGTLVSGAAAWAAAATKADVRVEPARALGASANR